MDKPRKNIISKRINLAELRKFLGKDARTYGSTGTYILSPATMEESTKRSISFCTLSNPDTLEAIAHSKAKVVFCPSDLPVSEKHYQNKTLILIPDPRLGFTRMLEEYFAEEPKFSISPMAVIDKKAEIHPKTFIGPYTCISRCTIGEGTVIYGNCHIYSGVNIGKNVTINAGTAIGLDGLDFVRNQKGELKKTVHLAGVVIKDNVHIGSNVCIHRGVFRDTVIGQGAKIGSLCNIGHESIIGKHCLISVESMTGGGCNIGDYSFIAMNVCIKPGVKIGKNVMLGMGSTVTGDIPDGTIAYGSPAKVIRQNPIVFGNVNSTKR